jgi:hypothetical protein
MKNFNEMNWNELRKAAKENGIKITTKEEVLNQLNALNIKEEVVMNTEVKEVVKEEVLEELGCIPGTEPVVGEAAVNATNNEVENNNEEMVNMVKVGAYIQSKVNGKFFKVESYATRGSREVAVLVYKNKLSDAKVSRTEIPAEWISTKYTEVTAKFVMDEMKKAEAVVNKAREQKVQAPKANAPRLEVNVTTNKGYRNWTVKDKATGKVYAASEGKSVTTLINKYKTTFKAANVEVSEYAPVQQAPVTNTTTQHVCSCCNKPVNKNVVDFLGRNQERIPAEHKGKVLCYSCQETTGVSSILRKYRTANGLNVMGNPNVTSNINGQPLF